MTFTYTVETRLADGTLVDTIAGGLTREDAARVVLECLAERDADTERGIVGILQIREDTAIDLSEWVGIWVITRDGRKASVIEAGEAPEGKLLAVRFMDGSEGYYHPDQVEPA